MTADDLMFYALDDSMDVAFMAEEREYETVWSGPWRDAPFALQDVEIDSWEILSLDKIGFNFTILDNFDNEIDFEDALLD